MNNYKCAIYAICKNEEVQVDTWISSVLEADYICVLDTGSTDKTYERLQFWQQKYPDKIFLDQKIIKPWRFDVARNESMKLIPKDADFCVCVDLDERLVQGWNEAFKKAWDLSKNKHRLFYKYAWSHNDDNTPARVFWYDKCHDNSGHWKWQFPVHEALGYFVDGKEVTNIVGDRVDETIWLHHFPTFKVERSNYLPLLEQRAKESPDDYYGLVYLAHEYFYQRQYEKCITFIDTEVFPKISQQDMYYCRTDLYLFKGKSYVELNQLAKAEVCFKQGIDESPDFRDNYLCLAQVYIGQSKFKEAVDIINQALMKSRRLYSWLEWDKSWTSLPADLLSICYYNLGAYDTAIMYSRLALEEDSKDPRLLHNYNLMKEMVDR